MGRAKEKVKSGSITIRMSDKDLYRLRAACNRDMLKASLFAHDAIIDKLNVLIKKQERDGYVCQEPI
jgi:hypothetical protein